MVSMVSRYRFSAFPCPGVCLYLLAVLDWLNRCTVAWWLYNTPRLLSAVAI